MKDKQRLSPRTQRFRRNLLLGLLAAAITAIAYACAPGRDWHHSLSMASAYSSLTFLAWSLWLGPRNVLRSRPNPVSFDERRDVSIWAGLLALLHTGVGLTVHLRGRMWMYFFKHLHPLKLQNTLFGFANYVGLFAALFFLMLLAISNDLSLRNLGTGRWKSLQRWAYAAAGLTIAHGIAFQFIEKRQLPWILIFASLALAAAGVQTLGFARVRRKRHLAAPAR